MTNVRIAHAEPWPGHIGDGKALIVGFLAVLADDAGHRAVPVWLLPGNREGGGSLPRLLDRAGGVTVTAGTSEEFGARLLRAAGVTVTAVDVEMTAAGAGELNPETATARIEVSAGGGPRQVTARLGLGLAVAAATGAPVGIDGAVLDRLAIPVPGDDVLGPVLAQIPPDKLWAQARAPAAARRPGGGRRPRPRFEPRNMAFADGLDRWDLGFDPPREAAEPADQDYRCAAEDGSAVLWAAVPQPAGCAVLAQTIFADDYLGTVIAFRAEVRAEAVAQQAGLCLDIFTRPRRVRAGPGEQGLAWPKVPVKAGRGHGAWAIRPGHEQHSVPVTGSSGWTRHEITARVPDDAEFVRFGITLTGPGRVGLRAPELTREA